MITERMQQLAGVHLYEGASKGYFFKEIYTPLIKNLKKESKKIGVVLGDWIYSKFINTTTLFFEGDGDKKDFDITLNVITENDEEVSVEIYVTVTKQKLLKTNISLTGNTRYDVQEISKKVIELAKKV